MSDRTAKYSDTITADQRANSVIGFPYVFASFRIYSVHVMLVIPFIRSNRDRDFIMIPR